MKTLLIADDNAQIIDVLESYAKKDNYRVYTAYNGTEALQEFRKRTYDMILLDVMMPGPDGFEVCREIRKESMVPVIMITARGEDYERIMGLDIGADDYVLKPFSPSEVMARMRAILRRTDMTADLGKDVLVRGSLRILQEEFQAYIRDDKVRLTKKEIEILWLLSANDGMVFSRTQILDSVWGYDYYGDSRTVDTHIKRLRAKLENYSHPDWNIITVRGLGYKFEVLQ